MGNRKSKVGLKAERGKEKLHLQILCNPFARKTNLGWWLNRDLHATTGLDFECSSYTDMMVGKIEITGVVNVAKKQEILDTIIHRLKSILAQSLTISVQYQQVT